MQQTPAASPPANSSLSLDRQLLVERMRLHSGALIRLPAIEAVFLMVLLLVLRPFVPWPDYLVWGAIVMTVSCIRAGVALFERKGTLRARPRLQRRVFIFLAWCSGAAYGFGSAYLTRYLAEPHLFLYSGIILALPAIGLLIAKASLTSLLGYGALIITPLSLALAERFPQHANALPFMVAAYLLGMALANRNTKEVLRHVTEASQRKNQLILELESRHIEVQKSMAMAQRSSENRTRVLASASHDLRQPLHALSTYAAVLEESPAQGTVEHIGKKVDEIIESLSGLLHKLLELSQLIAGQVTLNDEAFSLSALVSGVCDEFTPAAQSKGLLLTSDLVTLNAQGDPHAMRSVVSALIENAVRFTPSGEVRVRLAALPATKQALFSVTDTGIGIEEGEKEAIFDEYFQIGNQARDRHQGVGLGLSIAQRLCHLMGTGITVTSRPGEGSCFEVVLPLHSAQEDTARPRYSGTVLSTAQTHSQTSSQTHARVESPGSAMSAPASLAGVRSSPTGTTHNEDVQEEYVHIHAQAVARIPGVHALIIAGLSTQFSPLVKPELLLVWGLLLLVIDLGRSGLGLWVLKLAHAGHSIKKYHLHFTILAMLTGSAMMGGWALLAGNLSAIELALSATVLFVIPPVAVTLTQSSRRIQMAYTVPFLATLATVVGRSDPAYLPLLPLVTLMMCGLIYLAARDVEKLIVRAVSLRREMDSIAHKLEASSEDIRKATEQAELASAQRIRALASASHDLRQPLSALSLCNAVLVANPSPARVAQAVGTVRKIVQMLSGLLHNLLDLSRIDSGNPLLNRETVDISQVLSEVCNEFRSAAEQKKLSLVTDLESILLQIDPLAIGRIARNLLENAVKYSDHGQIDVTCLKDVANNQAVIEIRDTGRGIPQERLGQVFDEYFQVTPAHRNPGTGVGLGLSIVKSLCIMLDGSVEVESEQGKGSTFRVRLPLSAAPPNPGLASEAITTGAFKGRRILAIDDDMHVADSMRLLLTTWGMDCDLALNAAEAESSLEQHGLPDLILLDLRLPGPEHGAALAERLFARFGACPVIVITGETADLSVAEAIRLGFTVLKKPVMREALLKALHDVLTPPAVRTESNNQSP